MKTKDLGEKKLISNLITPKFQYKREYGMGDDAAIIPISGFDILATTDKIPEDLMALKMGFMSPFEHGRYLAEVNISDIAAMGGIPVALLLNLTMPDDFEVEYLSLFLDGVKESCDRNDVVVVGGDTKWGSAISFTATCIGKTNNHQILRRNGAKPGDDLYVSGMFGLFSTALVYFIVAKPRGLLLSNEEEDILKLRLVKPEAKVKVGELLSNLKCCSSCMDITDGFSQALYELGSASKVVFEIDEQSLTYHNITLKVSEYLKLKPSDLAFGVGLDLELLFTLRNNTKNTVTDKFLLIGRAIIGESNVLINGEGNVTEIHPNGWAHFTGSSPQEVVKKLLNLKA